MSQYTVLFDANVLYPAPMRDALMQLAVTDLFKAKWTADIHREWIDALLGLAGPKLHIWASSGTVHERYVSEFCRYITTFSAGILNPRPSETRSVLIGYFGLLGLIATIR